MSPPSGVPRPVGSNRLGGIDGLRAFAALWVLAFHIRAFSGARIPVVDLFVRSGSTGVSLFLVLSGFCLYSPFAGRLDRFRPRSFLRRRCRRLLPAYYASLVVVLAAVVAAGGRAGLPSLTAGQLAGQVATHATLTHQLFPATFYGLNGAYWSLGLEWELYLTLPFLVVAARRFGLGRTVAGVIVACVAYRLALATAVTVGALPAGSVWTTVVLPNTFVGRWAEFALGMLAADLHRRGRLVAWLRWAVPAAVACAVVGLLAPDNPLAHVLFGVVYFALLCTVLVGGNVVAAAFSWRPLVALGLMSYSLYLVHQPLVEIAAAVLRDAPDRTPTQVLVGLLLLVPLVMAAAWVLFVTVERPTLAPAARPASGPREAVRPVAAALAEPIGDGVAP